MLDPWLGFVNEEVSKHPGPLVGMDRSRVRQELLDRAATSFPFPLEVSFRGVITDHVEMGEERYLLVEPSGLSDEATDVIGGVLVPSDRQLYAGSVAEVQCQLADPDSYAFDEGILALGGSLNTIVPIEP